MKLSRQEKADRQNFMEELDLAGGMIRSSKPVEGDLWDCIPECHGFTVAVVPATDTLRFDAPDFFYVSASHCSPSEKFRRKRGELIALDRLFGGEYITVPAQGRDVGDVLMDTMTLMRVDADR